MASHKGRPPISQIADPRAEDLLCGCVLYWPVVARRAADRAGVHAACFTQAKSRELWNGNPEPRYKEYVEREYEAADIEITNECFRRALAGEDTTAYDWNPTNIATELAQHLVNLYQARQLIRQVNELLSDKPQQSTKRSGVTI